MRYRRQRPTADSAVIFFTVCAQLLVGNGVVALAFTPPTTASLFSKIQLAPPFISGCAMQRCRSQQLTGRLSRSVDIQNAVCKSQRRYRTRSHMSSQKTGVPRWGSSSTFGQEAENSNNDGDNDRENTTDLRAPDQWKSSRRWGKGRGRRDSRQNGDNGDNVQDQNGDAGRVPSAGVVSGNGVGSPEFVDLVRAQFDVLASMLDASQIVLFVRRENTETGELVLSEVIAAVQGSSFSFCGWVFTVR